MIIDLKKIFVNDNSSLPLEYSLDMSDLEYMGYYPLKKPVVLKGTVSNKASLVRLEASISYEYDAPCDRCGSEALREHSVKLDKSLAVRTESEESDTILVIPDMKLDLEELIYSEVVVNLPMKHLCKEDCIFNKVVHSSEKYAILQQGRKWSNGRICDIGTVRCH